MKKINIYFILIISFSIFLLFGCSSHKHNFSSYLNDDYLHWRECVDCKEKEDYVYHTYGSWQTIIPATEQQEGIRRKTCSVCKYFIEETTPKLSHQHQYSNWEIELLPTKTTTGKIFRSCVLDPSHKEEFELPVLNNYNYRYQLISASSCGNEGLERYIYVKDNEALTIEVVLPLIDHVYSEIWSSNELGHYHISICEHVGLESDFAPHVYLNGFCTECNYKEPEATHQHTYGDWELALAPTLTTEGQIRRTCLTNESHIETFSLPALNQIDYTYEELSSSTCSTQGLGCYTYVKDENIFNFEVSLPYADHPYDRQWSSDATHHWHNAICSHNSEKKDLEEHVFEKGKCKVCDYIEYTEDLIYEMNEDNASYRIAGIYASSETEIVIPATYLGLPVTKIKDSAFKGNASIEYVRLWEGIEEIGDYAFADCSNLTEVIYPATLKKIGSNSFENCIKLAKVELMEGLETIGNYAFYGCKNLRDISIPSSITYLGNRALSDTRLEGTLYEDGYYLGNAVNPYLIFYKTADLGKVNYILHSQTVFIYHSAFSQNQILESILLPKSVQYIGRNSFSSCDSLKYIYYEGSIEDFQQIEISSGNSIDEFILFYSNNPSVKGEWGFDMNHNPYPYV